MPELPEVETIRRGLSNKIIGRQIVDVVIDNEKSFVGDKKLVINKRVFDVQRRAKTLRILLTSGFNLLFHLKMTGQLIYVDNQARIAGGHPSHDWHDKLPNKHTRITFVFDNGSKLYFNDLRKFGWAKVLTDEEIEAIFKEYGPEPFSRQFTATYLQKRAKTLPERTIKQFIMDQAVIAGVGNIYADESLYLAKIMPTTKIKHLKKNHWKLLHKSILKVLELGIKYGGTTDSDYVDAEGKKGGMQDYLNVYHKTGEKCPKGCSGQIERIVIGGRGTNFCPVCQVELK